MAGRVAGWKGGRWVVSDLAWPTLFAELRDMTSAQPPGVQAHIEREAAAVRAELGKLGVLVTRAVLEAYAAVLCQHGEENIPKHDDPEWSADWHGYRMAAVAQLWESAP